MRLLFLIEHGGITFGSVGDERGKAVCPWYQLQMANVQHTNSCGFPVGWGKRKGRMEGQEGTMHECYTFVAGVIVVLINTLGMC